MISVEAVGLSIWATVNDRVITASQKSNNVITTVVIRPLDDPTHFAFWSPVGKLEQSSAVVHRTQPANVFFLNAAPFCQFSPAATVRLKFEMETFWPLFSGFVVYKGYGWAHSLARPLVPISSPPHWHVVYILVAFKALILPTAMLLGETRLRFALLA